MNGYVVEFLGIARSSFDTYVVVDRGNGSTTTMPKQLYIDADFRPSFDFLPVLNDGVTQGVSDD